MRMSRSSLRVAVKAKAWAPTQEEWTKAAQCVQPEEKERISHFVFKKDAKSAMVGRLLIRRIVAMMMEIPFNTVKLARTEKGKPYALNPDTEKPLVTGCHFNISHQGEYVVIAANKSKQVGVDVMKVEWPRKSSVQEFFSMMKRHLTEQEWSNVLRRTEDLEQLHVFYRHWCLKESVLKCLGTGIGLELSRLDFHTPDEELSSDQVTYSTYLEMDGATASDWSFEESMLDQHCVTVAMQPEQSGTSGEGEAQAPKSTDDKGETFTVWTIEELLTDCEPLAGTKPDQAYWDNFNAKEEEPTLS